MLTVIDTPSGETIYFEGGCRIKSIRVVGMAAGDTVVVTNQDGDTIWETIAAIENYVEESVMTRDWPQGFLVTALDSGKLYVETDPYYASQFL